MDSSMHLSRRHFMGLSAAAIIGLCAGTLATGCTSGSGNSVKSAPVPTGALAFDNDSWQYDSENDVYYQIGVNYCSSPSAQEYESLGIYVPGAYLSSTGNQGELYSCEINEQGGIGGFTSQNAPVVIPVNTAGYAAQPAPTSYDFSSISDYLQAGFIYVYAGCRGRDNGENPDGTTFEGGAPWAVTDLKAAIRYLRYNSAILPGSMDAVFSFGHSGGGAQSAVLGASGDNALYTPYLENIGAAMTYDDGAEISDAPMGSMCWCPITSLDAADAAYEWMMGQFATTDTREDGLWTAELSKDLAAAYGQYINSLGLVDEGGNALSLEEGGEGVYDSGSYYEYVLSTINSSLNQFLSTTEFPYTPSNSFMRDGGFGGGGAADGNGELGDRPVRGLNGADAPSGDLPAKGELGGKGGTPKGGDLDHGDAPGNAGLQDQSSQESVTYDTVQDYIDSLNGDDAWITYDAATNTATITSIAAFTSHCKTPTKAVGAFDDVARAQGENKVFGTMEEDALHFDATMAALIQDNEKKYEKLSGWEESYVTDYAGDLTKTNSLGTSMADRVNMYNPLYFVNDALGGKGTSTVAPHWKIHSGIEQTDTSLTTELNLACGLRADETVQDVEFATVWGQGHTMAELTGTGSENFINWVKEIAS